MSLIYLVLALIRQYQLVPLEKLGEFQLECEDWEKTAVPSNTKDKVKQMYGKLHYGQYGIVVRMLMPFAFLWLRKEIADFEKGEQESLFDD